MGNTSFIINDWFITDLKLKGNDLLVFALIFSFTKDGRTKYYGSISYLSEVLGCSKRTINYCLESLTNRGLIVKKIQKNANEPNKYHVDLEVVQKLHKGSAKIAPEVVQKLRKGSAKIAHNNNIYNNIDNNSFYDINILKDYYLSKEKIINAILTNNENKTKLKEDLIYKIEKFNEHLIQKGKLCEKFPDYCSYFRNCLKKGMFKKQNKFIGNIYNELK